MKKAYRWLTQWCHRIAGHTFIVVENGKDEVFAGWASEYHESDGQIIIYRCNPEDDAVRIDTWTDVIIGAYYWNW